MNSSSTIYNRSRSQTQQIKYVQAQDFSRKENRTLDFVQVHVLDTSCVFWVNGPTFNLHLGGVI